MVKRNQCSTLRFRTPERRMEGMLLRVLTRNIMLACGRKCSNETEAYHFLMPIRTKQWDDPREPDDGYRLLVCRYRPRGLPKEAETWDGWDASLGPSRELHAAAYGKGGESGTMKIDWASYRRRYLIEMRAPGPAAHVRELAARVRAGETITLLCSSACVREARCHRSLLRELIEHDSPSHSGASTLPV